MAHWKKFMDKNYLGSWDIEDKDLVLTIKSVGVESVNNPTGASEDKLVMHFVEDYKPMILNSTNCKAIEKATGTPDIDKWAGNKISIFTTKIIAFGEETDALRIRSYKPVQAKKYYCDDCGKEITNFGNMDAEAVAMYSKNKYGKCLCVECGKKIKENE